LALDICHFDYPALSSDVPVYLGTLQANSGSAAAPTVEFGG
jgi:hypothetical protein